jgi:hypothetical protein
MMRGRRRGRNEALARLGRLAGSESDPESCRCRRALETNILGRSGNVVTER